MINKKINLSIIFALICTSLCLFLSSCAHKANWTLMFYICGSNLEDGASEDGSNLNQDNVKGIASQEIYKLVNADFSNNVNVIIETGGARLWSKSPIFGEVTNAEIRHDVLQRWQIKNHKMILLQTLYDQPNSMSTSETFGDFVNYSIKEFPASNYGLTLWDHGGAWDGTCADANSKHWLTPLKMSTGLSNALINQHLSKLNFINFYSCMNANIDILNWIGPYADYIVASEDLIYLKGALDSQRTDIVVAGEDLKHLVEYVSNNTKAKTIEICKLICNDFASLQDQYIDAEAGGITYTMSVFECNKILPFINEFNKWLSLSHSDDSVEFLNAFQQCGENSATQVLGRDISGNAIWALIDLYSWVTNIKNSCLDSENIINESNKFLAEFNNLIKIERHETGGRFAGHFHKGCYGLNTFYPKPHGWDNEMFGKNNYDSWSKFSILDNYKDIIKTLYYTA